MLAITNITERIVTNRGDNVTLRCNGVGENSVNISWVTPTGQVNTSSFIMESLDFIWTAPDFVINDVNASDGGTYTCIAEDEDGSVNASVVVYVTPYFTAKPADIVTTNGSIAMATCRAEGFPPPDFKWVASGENCNITAVRFKSLPAISSGSGESNGSGVSVSNGSGRGQSNGSGNYKSNSTGSAESSGSGSGASNGSGGGESKGSKSKGSGNGESNSSGSGDSNSSGSGVSIGSGSSDSNGSGSGASNGSGSGDSNGSGSGDSNGSGSGDSNGSGSGDSNGSGSDESNGSGNSESNNSGIYENNNSGSDRSNSLGRGENNGSGSGVGDSSGIGESNISRSNNSNGSGSGFKNDSVSDEGNGFRSDKSRIYVQSESLIFEPVLFGDENFTYCCIVSNMHKTIHSSFIVTGKYGALLHVKLKYMQLLHWVA